MYQQILLDIDDPVATITLNRPDKLNAITDRMGREIRHAVAEAERSAQVIGIIITGAGRGFSAGLDMAELQTIQSTGLISSIRGQDDLPTAHPGDPAMGDDFRDGWPFLFSVRKPVIAAINGPCAGYGFSLAMFCDLRFVSDRAALIPSFSPRGLVAEHGTSWILPRLLGPSKALEVLWSGRRFDANEALRLGLVNRVCEHDQLLADAKAYLRDLASTSSPASLMYMKQQVYRHLMLPLGQSMQDTNRLQDLTVTLPDFREGMQSFLERREPRFPRVTAGR
jgi:enoyl-CoA hydratase/carnithine racemase